MKIAAVKTVVVNAQMRNWVFIKVETDQPGLYGWGEGSPGRRRHCRLTPVALLPVDKRTPRDAR